MEIRENPYRRRSSGGRPLGQGVTLLDGDFDVGVCSSVACVCSDAPLQPPTLVSGACQPLHATRAGATPCRRSDPPQLRHGLR